MEMKKNVGRHKKTLENQLKMENQNTTEKPPLKTPLSGCPPCIAGSASRPGYQTVHRASTKYSQHLRHIHGVLHVDGIPIPGPWLYIQKDGVLMVKSSSTQMSRGPNDRDEDEAWCCAGGVTSQDFNYPGPGQHKTCQAIRTGRSWLNGYGKEWKKWEDGKIKVWQPFRRTKRQLHKETWSNTTRCWSQVKAPESHTSKNWWRGEREGCSDSPQIKCLIWTARCRSHGTFSHWDQSSERWTLIAQQLWRFTQVPRLLRKKMATLHEENHQGEGPVLRNFQNGLEKTESYGWDKDLPGYFWKKVVHSRS